MLLNGGGTGTGAAPVIAKPARERIPTVGVVTKPFILKGLKDVLAEKGIEDLQQYVDTLFCIPNQTCLELLMKTTLLMHLKWLMTCYMLG